MLHAYCHAAAHILKFSRNFCQRLALATAVHVFRPLAE